MTFRRYVALGDSITEGVGDPRPDGTLRGWADRLAAALAERMPGLQYANLALRGRRTAQILDEQAGPAVALGPDLISAAVGVNDLASGALDIDTFSADVDTLFATLRADGSTVVSSTLPDLTAIMSLPRRLLVALWERRTAMNTVLMTRAHQHGVLMLALDELPSAADRKLWSPDRLHPNAVGHALLADAMLQLITGAAVAVTATTQAGYGTVPYARAGAAATVLWCGQYVAPRMVRRLRGRSSGDGRSPKLVAYVDAGTRQ